MIGLKTKLSDLYGNNVSNMSNTAKRRKLQILLDILHCYENVSKFRNFDDYKIPNFSFQIQYSVSASQVMFLSELLKFQESIARDDMVAGKLTKNNYDTIVMKAKQKFVNGVLKHKNKFHN